MKRMISIFFAIAMMCSLAGCGTASPDTAEGTEGLIYEQSNGSYMVTGYTGSEVDIVIPDTYNDVEVTRVAEEAFLESDVQSVMFGQNITTVEEDAFKDCTLLKTITFTGTDICIEGYAFSKCISLTDITFTQSEYAFNADQYAFHRCESLTELDLSNATLGCKIVTDSLSYCENLATLTVPSDVSFTQARSDVSAVNGVLNDCDATIIYS